VHDRQVLAAILYLTQAGCSWWKLPEAVFGVTRPPAHRRFAEWTRAGRRERLHQAVRERPGAAGQLDWSRAVVDSISVRAEKGRPDRPRSTVASRAARSTRWPSGPGRR
jgi:transposase